MEMDQQVMLALQTMNVIKFLNLDILKMSSLYRQKEVKINGNKLKDPYNFN